MTGPARQEAQARPPTGRRAVAAVCLALGLALADAAGAAEGVRHRDWTAACQGDGSGLCFAETRARGDGGAKHLRVTRDAEGRARDVALMTGTGGLSEEAPLNLQVDGKAPLSIRYASAVGRLEAGRYRLVDAALVGKLVAQMKAGRRLRVSYRDRAGEAQTAVFSLMGLTAALRSHQRGTPAAGKLPAGKPQGPPDLYPPPLDDGRPETGDLPKQAGAVFTPAGEAPPVGGCYEHQRVQDDKGYFTGWSSTNLCR